jgi:hypothetical protein
MNAATEIFGGYIQQGGPHGGEYDEIGGTNQTTALFLAYGDIYSSGIYHLNGTGTLNCQYEEYIGIGGAGKFQQGADGQNNTLNSCNDLILGVAGWPSSYELDSGYLYSASEEIYGSAGNLTTFTQYGGTNTLLGAGLQVGSYIARSSAVDAEYNLEGGSLSAISEAVIGAGHGFAEFFQEGATNTTYTLTVGGAAGTGSGDSASYILYTGTLTVNGNEYVGYTSSDSGSFVQEHGSNTATGSGSIIIGESGGSTGDYDLEGGSVSAGAALDVGSSGTGTFEMYNSSSVHAGWEFIGHGNTGTFTQDGGTHQVDSYIDIGTNSTGLGTYLLESGTLSVGGGGGVNGIFIGDNGNGTLNQSGGVLNSTVNLYVGHNAGSTGTYTMSAGSATISTGIAVGYQGTGTISQTGGSIIIPSGGTWINIGDAATGVGNYTLGGGTSTATLSVPAAFVGDAGQGTLTVDSNGTLTCTGALTVGNSSGSSGTLIMNGGAITAGSLLFASAAGSGGTGTIWGGTLTVANTIGVTNGGSLVIHGGTVASQADEYATGSTTITSITQYSGSNSVNGTIYLDSYQGASVSGLYNLYGGTLTTGYQQVGVYGNGFFSQSGGNETINNFLIIGNHSGSTGSFYWGTSTLQINGAAHIGGYFGAGGNGSFILQGGTANIAGGVNVYADNSYFWVEAGTLTTPAVNNYSTYFSEGVILTGGTANMGAVSGTGDMQVGGPGPNYGPAHGVASSFQQNLLNITSHGSLQITGGTNNTINSLSIDTTGGVLDITNTHLFIHYGSGPDPVTSIAAYLASGYNAGAWNGPGIDSSTAAVTPGYGIGYADSSDPGNPAGLASGQIEVAYTLLGDADLNRVVNGIDFGILAANFNKTVSRWDQGDFNYDHIVNGIDFTALAANFNKGANGVAVGDSALSNPAIVAFAEANGLMADVPEPTALGLGAIALLGLPRRRRGNSQKSRAREGDQRLVVTFRGINLHQSKSDFANDTEGCYRSLGTT